MTVEEERCPCSETSEPSNVTFTTDVSSIINTSEVPDISKKPHVDTKNDYTRKADEEQAATSPTRGAALPSSGQPPSANHQPQKGQFQPSAQFEPAVQCLCHAYRVKQSSIPEKYEQRNIERFSWKWPRKEYAKRKDKLYEVKVKRNHYRHYSKPYSDQAMTEGIPKEENHEFDKSNDDANKYTGTKGELEEISERIDIYYFDHGNSAYYRTTDSPPILATEKCAEKTDYAATRFWAEIFGTIHIGIAFVTAFILQLLRFVLFSIVRPLTVGILQLFADYFIKPLLSIFFNAIIQPILILLYNIATSIRDLCEPIAEAIGFFLREIAALVRAFRIVEINRINNQTTGCT